MDNDAFFIRPYSPTLGLKGSPDLAKRSADDCGGGDTLVDKMGPSLDGHRTSLGHRLFPSSPAVQTISRLG
ncbi:hypothetical protein DTO027B9_4882 [Paecilomyces variotii]|nr:hypothetical protein DTO027B9_4882 [Paecilomyces variotii]